MTIKRSQKGTASSVSAGLTVGTAVSMGITILGAMLLGRMIASEQLPWERVGYGIMLILFLSSFLGAYIACGRIKRKKMMIAGCSGLLYFAVLLMSTALFFGGQYEAVGVTALMILAGSGCCFLVRNTSRRAGKRRKPGKHYR